MKIPILLLMLCAIAHGSPAPEEVIAAPSSTYAGRSFESCLTRAHISSSPVWNHAKEEHPPLSPMKAKAAAFRVLASIVPQGELEREWELSSINLSPSAYSDPDKPKWIYFIHWTGPRIGYIRTDTGEFVTKRISRGRRHQEVYDQFRLIVLMNGKCIEPEERTPNKTPEHIPEGRKRPSENAQR